MAAVPAPATDPVGQQGMHPREATLRLVFACLDDDQRAAVVAVFADDLERGWIPPWWDVEAVIDLVRARQRALH